MQRQRENAMAGGLTVEEQFLINSRIDKPEDLLPVAMLLRRGVERVAAEAEAAQVLTRERCREYLGNPWATTLQALDEADYEAASAERARAEYYTNPEKVAFVRRWIAELIAEIKKL